jgi:peptidoglycan/LPS O-acetylase OafA/YrhL
MVEAVSSSGEVISNKIQAIQGLRGFAVLLVVLCHLEVPFFENGFIGVDIFFVISGFLITRIMIREYVSNRKASRRQGWISFLAFYARRIRRIVPASYFVILLVLVVGTAFPKAINLVGTLVNDASWAAFFLSNLNYADQATQYFGETTQQSPLLHYWSLAVEEQFYIFWPVFFLTVTSAKGFKVAGIVFNWKNRLRAAMLAVTFLSFTAYLILISQDSPSGYYSSIARFWEFSIGALFSFGLTVRAKNKINLLFLGALLFLVASFFVLSISQIRVVSVLFVIATGYLLNLSVIGQLPKSILGILENKFLCFLGKISFSLYLIHWPMIVFLKNFGFATDGFHILLIFPGMILVAMFLFKEVEDRFMKLKIPTVSKRSAARRTRYFPLNYDALKYSSVLIFAFILIVNFQMGNSKPFVTSLFKAKVVEPWIAPTETKVLPKSNPGNPSPAPSAGVATIYDLWKQKIASGLQATTLPNGIQPSLNELDSDRLSRWNLCLTIIQDNPKCNIGPTNAPKKVYILGDSYALSATPMVFGTFSDSQYQVIARNRGQCMVPDVQTINGGKVDSECAKHRDEVNEEIAKVRPYLVIAMSLNSNSVKGNRGNLISGMIKEYEFLVENSEHVLVIGETPFTADPRSCLNSSKKVQNCVGDGKSRQEYRLITESASRKVGAEYLDITPWLCIGSKCPVVIDNSFVTWDGGHLTTTFSRKLAPLFSDYLSKLGIFNS